MHLLLVSSLVSIVLPEVCITKKCSSKHSLKHRDGSYTRPPVTLSIRTRNGMRDEYNQLREPPSRPALFSLPASGVRRDALRVPHASETETESFGTDGVRRRSYCAPPVERSQTNGVQPRRRLPQVAQFHDALHSARNGDCRGEARRRMARHGRNTAGRGCRRTFHAAGCARALRNSPAFVPAWFARKPLVPQRRFRVSEHH